MADFIPVRTNANALSAVPIVDGQIIAVYDTKELYLDKGNNRQKYSDIIFDTYSNIITLIAPLSNKIYYATDTNKLLKYSNGFWIILNDGGSGSGDGGTYVYGSPQALITKANSNSPIVNDNTRGYLSVDFQSERESSEEYSKGDYSFLFGKNSSNIANSGYAFGSGTRFDVNGAIQTNQFKTGTNDYQGHTGVLGLSFTDTGNKDIEIFKINTGTIVLLQIDFIGITSYNLGLTLERYDLAIYQGILTSCICSYSPVCSMSPGFYLSDNKLWISPQNSYMSNIQLGIRYTIMGNTQDEGNLS